jgi:c-di-GMP-binding flagellar brake protein YcgR
MPNDSKKQQPDTPANYDLAEINLRIGARLQLSTERTSPPRHYFAPLIGYLAGEAVLVRTPMENGLSVPFQEGEQLSVRVFSGVQVYSFKTSVNRTLSSPFPCLYLAFPRTVIGTPLRKAIRVKVDIPVQATRSGAGEAPKTDTGSLTNLSVTGGRIESEMKLGDVQDEIEISFAFVVQPEDREVRINARAIIRNVNAPKPDSSQRPGPYAHGIEFVNLDPNELAKLQTLIYDAVLAIRQYNV